MTTEASSRSATAAVAPTSGALAAAHPIDAPDQVVTGGFWADRLRLNRDATIPHAFGRLVEVGNLENLRLAAGATGTYRALGLMFDQPFPFLDSDVYKWLEGVAWELAREDDPAIRRMADEAIGRIEAAQRPDGYLNSFVQVIAPDGAYRDLAWGHELYCIGHLAQAAVSWQRALGDDRLLRVAERAADSVRAALLPRDGAIEGHPEIEMALVELYRVTGAERHLDLARALIDRRGHGFLGPGRFGTTYWQDHLPVRDAPTVTGHAVRQLYLDAGAVDVATETGDRELLEAVHRRWRDMVATRTYLTGGLGSRHVGEAFGDPYELPPDRAYAETCAAIGGVMVAWRLLLATGDPLAADVIERTALNGVLGALSRDGTSFFYVNPLQRRTARAVADPGTGRRASWYPCACCPPNLVRFVASWPQLLATRTDEGLRIQQYAAAEIGAELAGGRLRLAVETAYPWSGAVRVTVREAPDAEVRLELRVPGWASGGATVTWPERGAAASVGDGETSVGLRRRWRAGDTVVLDLPIEPRIVRPHPRVDAVRGCVALERGPLVGAFESDDLPGGVELEDVAIRPDEPLESEPRPDLGDDVVGVSAGGEVAGDPRAIRLRAIPYHAWANRSDGAMRVWIPAARGTADGPR